MTDSEFQWNPLKFSCDYCLGIALYKPEPEPARALPMSLSSRRLLCEVVRRLSKMRDSVVRSKECNTLTVKSLSGGEVVIGNHEFLMNS